MSGPVEALRPLAIPGAHKIRPEHLTKTAFTYVRQSSPVQSRFNFARRASVGRWARRDPCGLGMAPGTGGRGR